MKVSCGVFFLVVGQEGRSVTQSVEVTPKRSKSGVSGVRDSRDRVPKRVRDSRDKVSKKSSRHAWPKAVGQVKASGNLNTKPSRPGLSSGTGQVKASGAQSNWPVSSCERGQAGVVQKQLVRSSHFGHSRG